MADMDLGIVPCLTRAPRSKQAQHACLLPGLTRVCSTVQLLGHLVQCESQQRACGPCHHCDAGAEEGVPAGQGGAGEGGTKGQREGEKGKTESSVRGQEGGG